MGTNGYTLEEYDVERMLTNLDVDCTSSEHISQQILAAAGLAVWSFGVPLLFFCILYKCKSKLHTDSYIQTIGFLYNGFEPQVYWFESFIMIRKVVFVICSVT